MRHRFAEARRLVLDDIGVLQKKIRRKLMLTETLKILETIKYIDKANSTIKVLFEKTDYRKVSEIVSVLNSSFDNQLHRIKVFENKLVEINRLKQMCLDNLLRAALAHIGGLDPASSLARSAGPRRCAGPGARSPAASPLPSL